MLKHIFLILVSVALGGCVGVKTYTEKSYPKPYFEPFTLDELNVKHKNLIASQDGSSYKYVAKDDEWCGAVIYAVILPIPFMAPVCERGSKFEIEDKIVIKQIDTSVREGGKACGPLQFLFNGMMSFGQGSQGWCS